MVVHLCSSFKPSKTGDEEGTHLHFVNDNRINIIIQNVNSKFLSLSMYYTRCNNINSFLTLYSRTVFLFSILKTRKKLEIRQWNCNVETISKCCSHDWLIYWLALKQEIFIFKLMNICCKKLTIKLGQLHFL